MTDKSLFDKLIEEHIQLEELKGKIKYKREFHFYIDINDLKIWIWDKFKGVEINTDNEKSIKDLLNDIAIKSSLDE